MYPDAQQPYISLAFRIVTHSQNGYADTVEIPENEEPLLSEETVVSVIGLVQTLRKIRARLLNEGKI